MRYWLIPSNPYQFDLVKCVEEHQMVYWRQTRYHYELGDIVFMYATSGIGRILYVMEVEEVNIPNTPEIIEISKTFRIVDQPPTNRVNKFRLIQKVGTHLLDQEHLREHGLRGNVQGSQNVSGHLLDYILSNIGEYGK